MKYKLEITIDLARDKVIEIFDNPDNMVHWQKGFISLEHLSGTPGDVGAKSKLKYKMGKREIEMIETITKRNLPDEFSATYEAKDVWNDMKNYFIEMEPDRTKWISEAEFKFNGFMKIIAFLMPSSFKKQSYKYMVDFKKFAETKNK